MTQKIIDLSLPITHGMRGVEIHPNTSYDVDGFNTTNLHLYSHAGTHMDAPRHFLNEGGTMERLDLNKCVGPAIVIDLSHKAPNSLIEVEDIGSKKDQIRQGTRVLLRTDWDTHAEMKDYRTHFPRISPALADWFVECGIWLVGVQTPSVASLTDREELRIVHQTLLGAEIVIVESLANLNVLPDEVFFIATPLKIDGGDGCPVRAIALTD